MQNYVLVYNNLLTISDYKMTFMVFKNNKSKICIQIAMNNKQIEQTKQTRALE